MKVSLNSIKFMNQRYGCGSDPAAGGVQQLIDKVGAQLGAIEEVIDLGSRYQGILIVRVVSSVQHPNADRLRLCKIDDGGKAKNILRDEQGYVQVVCGAPNVHEGMLAAWLPPGSTVPASLADAEPFVLEAREIRGIMSNGMLASPKELAISDSHEGILEIEGDYEPGTDFAEVFELKGDIVLDIENKMFTHRPDCFGFLGVARELAGIQQQPFKSPAWYVPTPDFPAADNDSLPLTFRNELPDLVPRFTAVTMSDVQVGPSPVWLQVELAKVGQRSINNIVDYTNFFMLETGQPLHAYDYDKVKAHSSGEGATLVVRNSKPGEKLGLLNGKTIEPRPEAIMIATDTRLIGVGGVMGGADTEVDEHTTNIILESANFDMYSIRRTSMTHGLFTDAVTRFNKGQSPLQNLAVLAKITGEVQKFASGKVAGPLIDDNHLDSAVMERQSLHPSVTLGATFINARLGLSLSAEEMKALLENVEFSVDVSGDELTVSAPFWRTDIELREDVVEEIGRLYGYDKLPLNLPRRDLTPVPKDQLLELKNRLRQTLSWAGANEVLTYSFVHGKLLDRVGQRREDAYQISNALSPELQYYRLNVTPSLLEKVHPNIKAGYKQFALFEIGKAHMKIQGDPNQPHDDVPPEAERLALVFAADNKADKAYGGAPFYQARTYLMQVLRLFSVEDKVEFEMLDPERYIGSTKTKIPQYEVGRTASIILGNINLGEIGEYRSAVRKALKLPEFSAGFELDLSSLANIVDKDPSYRTLPRFPKVEQDISLKVAANMPYQQLFRFVQDQLQNIKPNKTQVSLQPLDIYQREGDVEHKQITLRLSIASYERTLTDAEVNKLLDAVAAAVQESLHAERI